MKHLSLLALICIFACSEKNTTTKVEAPKPTQNFDWLIGDWKRSDDEAGKQTYEHWQKSNDKLYQGKSYTMSAKDTVWSENVRLLKRDTTWFYAVTGRGDSFTTDFQLTSITDHSFVCENGANEFPKMIEYALVGDSIKSKISGGGPEIEFSFGK